MFFAGVSPPETVEMAAAWQPTFFKYHNALETHPAPPSSEHVEAPLYFLVEQVWICCPFFPPVF